MLSGRTASTAKSIGRRVSQARRAANLTQAQLARVVGLDRTVLSKIESGRRAVAAEELARIARKLGRPIDWFLPTQGGDGRARPTMKQLKARRDEILQIASNYGASNVRVFGSTVRGKAGRGSDIDFLIDMDAQRSLLDLAGLVVELERLLGREVDVVTADGLRETVRDRILEEAIPI